MGKVAKKNAVATPMEVDSGDSSDSDVIVQAKPPPKKSTPAAKKAPEPSSSEEDSSENEDAKPVKKPAAKPTLKAATKPAAKVEESSSDDSDDESSDSSEDEDDKPAPKAKSTPAAKPKSTPAVQAKPAAKAKLTPATAKESSEEESDSDSDEEEGEEKPKTKPKATPVKATPAKPPAKVESESEDDEEDEEEEEEKAKPKPKATPAKKVESSEDEDEDEDEDESEEEADKPAAKKQKLENGKGAATKASEVQTPEPKGTGGGAKTLFVGNLAFSATQEDIEEFFGDCGEISNVRIATHEDGSMRGFGHVDFATEAAAKKALSKSGQHLCGRAIRCDLARERGTPGNTGTAEKRSFGGPATTVFVKGFDRDQEEETIRDKLKDFFKDCGEVTRVKIPTDRESGQIKGFAYIDFSNEDAQDKAKELNGNELDGYSLVVDAATSFSSPAGGGRGGDRGFGRGGRGRGDRGRGRGDRGRGGRGDRGGRSGGRGAPRQKISLTPAGKKTTFADE